MGSAEPMTHRRKGQSIKFGPRWCWTEKAQPGLEGSQGKAGGGEEDSASMKDSWVLGPVSRGGW